MTQSKDSQEPSLAEMIRKRHEFTKTLILAIVGIVVVGVVVLLATLAAGPRSAYDGIPQAVNSEDGAPLLGNWESPKATLAVFLDFADVASARLHRTLLQLVDPYIRTGDVLFVEYLLWDVTLYQSSSLRAAESVYCAGEQGAFWQMHDALFNLWERQFEAYGRVQAPPPAYDEAEVWLAAQQIQIDPQAISACISEGRQRETLDAAAQTATALGISTVPAVYLNWKPLLGEDGNPLTEPTLPQLQAALDAAIHAQPASP